MLVQYDFRRNKQRKLMHVRMDVCICVEHRNSTSSGSIRACKGKVSNAGTIPAGSQTQPRALSAWFAAAVRVPQPERRLKPGAIGRWDGDRVWGKVAL